MVQCRERGREGRGAQQAPGPGVVRFAVGVPRQPIGAANQAAMMERLGDGTYRLTPLGVAGALVPGAAQKTGTPPKVLAPLVLRAAF